MKGRNLLLLILSFVFFSCSTFQQTNSIPDQNKVANELIEYDIFIDDPEFESWYIIHHLKSAEKSNEYYRNWNNIYTKIWNNLVLNGYSCFENRIDFDSTIDYGFDVNHKLYHYFKFIEEKFGINLMHH